MRIVSLLTFTLALAGFGTALRPSDIANAQGAGTGGVKSVIELFTSQGCSSCPTADALLETYVARPGVLALTFSVDYWDYLGWKDTLASPRFTKRQRAYAKARGDGQIYTPQIVVNGLAHVTGSNKRGIDGALAETASNAAQHWVPIRISSDGGKLIVEAGAGAKADATLWLLAVSSKVEVEVPRGENAGRTLTYFNVVRDATPVGMWSGQPLTVRLERQSIGLAGADLVAVVLQEGMAGPILGAAVLRN